MTSITTDGRALADAASLARKLTIRHAVRAELTVVDGRAELVATDGATGIVEVVGTGSAPDGVRVALAADLDALRKLRRAGDVTIREGRDGFTMTADGVTSPVAEAGELPAWPRFAAEADAVAVDVRGDDAVEVAATLRSVARAAASDADARAILTYVALREGEAAATDTYRMNVAEVPAVGDPHAVGLVPASWLAAIPSRGVTRLGVVASEAKGDQLGTAEVTFTTSTRNRTRDVTIVGPTTYGPFPNYRSLMPAEASGTVVTIPDGLGDVLGRMARPVTVGLGADELVLTDPHGVTASVGTAIAPALDGPDAVDLDPAYLDQLVEHVGPGATVRVRDGLRALVAEADGRTTLLMPMRGAS